MAAGSTLLGWNGSRQSNDLCRLTFNDASLTTLRVGVSHNKVGRDEMRLVATTLKTNTNLKELCLHGGSLALDVTFALANSLRFNNSLQTLRLEQITFSSPTAATHLLEALKDNCSIKELHLYKNRFNETMTDALQSLLEGNDTLKVLSMKRNYVGNALNCRHSNLQELELTECWGCAPAISTFVQHNTSLERLYLLHTGTNFNDLIPLFQRLEQNTTLDELVITGSAFNDECAASLASLLRKNSTLTKLRLWGNHIGSFMTTTIAPALAEKESIIELRIVKNGIDDAGASALAEALSTNTTIQTIDLSDNRIGDSGAKELLHLTRRNANIESCLLRDNNKRLDSSISANVRFETKVNKALKEDGRRAIGDVSLPHNLWPLVLDRIKNEPAVLHHVLRQRPDILTNAGR